MKFKTFLHILNPLNLHRQPFAVSGIPQSKAAYWNEGGILSLKETFWRYVLAVVSSDSGNSLGREGPTVHLCASIASQIGQKLKQRDDAFREMIPVGIGAGIAASVERITLGSNPIYSIDLPPFLEGRGS